MELMDPSLHDTFFTIEGMAWTPEMAEAVQAFLTPNDETFIARQIDFYRDYYNGVNEIYSEIYGVNLPKNEFYSPISREGVKKDEVGKGEFLKEMPARAAVTSGSLKSRTQNSDHIRDLLHNNRKNSKNSTFGHYRAIKSDYYPFFPLPEDTIIDYFNTLHSIRG